MPLLIALLVAALAVIWAAVVSRRTKLPAEVRIVDPEGAPTIDADGAARSVQAAELTVPADALVELGRRPRSSAWLAPTGAFSSAARWG